ncbi:carbon storage regulator [Lentibacillus sp. CBA3610]|uniref:carbon storage regulator n=1 Tax=Lentibacillus sp. CBA3610 TaxID=2518176 RepID=UPI001596228B|nr:carbon storage regulator [Lentibacillus sp. CBA3610]QKY70997.1 carbon storage regulator [Lentibacillus sp. CBA3610]
MALTLRRKPGEKVFIEDEHGRNIEVEVVKAEGNMNNALKLRITAPQVFNIVRGEIYGNNS